MTFVTWRFGVVQGSVTKALEWAKSIIATRTKSGLVPSKWWILRPRSGDTARFSIVGQYASMAEFETHSAKEMQTPDFRLFQKKG